MALTDDLKKRAAEAIRDPKTREKIESLARENGESFNKAMKRFFADDKK